MNSSYLQQKPAGGPLVLSLGVVYPGGFEHQQTKAGLPPEVRYSGQGEHVSGFGFRFGFGKYPSPVRVRPVHIPKIEKKKNTGINFGGPPRSDFEKSPISIQVGHPTSPAKSPQQKAQGNRPGALRDHIRDRSASRTGRGAIGVFRS